MSTRLLATAAEQERHRGRRTHRGLELKSGGSTDTTQNIGTFSRRVGRHIFEKNPTYSKNINIVNDTKGSTARARPRRRSYRHKLHIVKQLLYGIIYIT